MRVLSPADPGYVEWCRSGMPQRIRLLKLAAENAQKAFKLAKSGEKIPETFKDFLEKWVYSCEDQPALLDKIGGSRLMRLKNEPHLGYSTTH